MANSRYYSSIAKETNLTSAMNNSTTFVQVASTVGFPGTTPFTLAIDYGAANEELVEVTAVSALTLTVTRAIDGTSATSHNPGAVVRHVSSARDFTDSRTHEASTTNIHGLTGVGNELVGTTSTQTLANKTLDKATGTLSNVTLFNNGNTFFASVVGDSTNPNVDRFAIMDNEVGLNAMARFTANGALMSNRQVADTDATYRFRMVDTDGTTDRWAVLAGGTAAISPKSTTSLPGLQITPADASASKQALRISDSGGTNPRLNVYNDGRIVQTGTNTGAPQFLVNVPNGQSVDAVRVSLNANTVFGVQSNGRTLANVGATIAQPGVTSGPVLQVGGSNVGYTGNLTQWVSPANAIVANIDQAGNFNGNGGTFAGALSASNLTGWTTYTPSWVGLSNAGTGATMTGRWMRSGNKITVIAILVAGSTGASLGTGNITVTLPFAAASVGSPFEWVSTGKYNPNNGSAWRDLRTRVTPGSSSAEVWGINASTGGWSTPGNASYVFQAGTVMSVQLEYEV